MNKTQVTIHMFLFVMFAVVNLSLAADQDVQGVFGLSLVEDDCALAVWVSTESGAVVKGVKWFNNDDLTAFPEILAVAGDPGRPAGIALATPVAWNVFGSANSWSEARFSQPVTSSSEGLYLIFRIPDGAGFEYSGSGGGCGFGYSSGEGAGNCWLMGGGDSWRPIVSEYSVAAIPTISADKGMGGNEVLILAPPAGQYELALEDSGTVSMSTNLSAYPNPFNPVTQVNFSLKKRTHVDLRVFDIRGRLVKELLVGDRPEGDYLVEWDGKGSTGALVPSGTYFVRLYDGATTSTVTCTLLK